MSNDTISNNSITNDINYYASLNFYPNIIIYIYLQKNNTCELDNTCKLDNTCELDNTIIYFGEPFILYLKISSNGRTLIYKSNYKREETQEGYFDTVLIPINLHIITLELSDVISLLNKIINNIINNKLLYGATIIPMLYKRLKDHDSYSIMSQYDITRLYNLANIIKSSIPSYEDLFNITNRVYMF